MAPMFGLNPSSGQITWAHRPEIQAEQWFRPSRCEPRCSRASSPPEASHPRNVQRLQHDAGLLPNGDTEMVQPFGLCRGLVAQDANRQADLSGMGADRNQLMALLQQIRGQLTELPRKILMNQKQTHNWSLPACDWKAKCGASTGAAPCSASPHQRRTEALRHGIQLLRLSQQLLRPTASLARRPASPHRERRR